MCSVQIFTCINYQGYSILTIFHFHNKVTFIYLCADWLEFTREWSLTFSSFWKKKKSTFFLKSTSHLLFSLLSFFSESFKILNLCLVKLVSQKSWLMVSTGLPWLAPCPYALTNSNCTVTMCLVFTIRKWPNKLSPERRERGSGEKYGIPFHQHFTKYYSMVQMSFVWFPEPLCWVNSARYTYFV